MTGLALIAGAVVLIGPETPYPGLAALLPVLGSALVILGGGGAAGRPSRLLASALPRWLGHISYSLYLWHWPLIVLVPMALGVESLGLNLLLVGVAVVIAALSTELLEMPIRQGRRFALPARASVAVGLTASVLVAAGAVTAGTLVLVTSRPDVVAAATRPASGPGQARIEGLSLPAPLRTGPVPADIVPALVDAYWDLPRGYADGCHLDYATTEPPDCRYGPPDGAMSVVLLGDSHAQQWLPALEALAGERGWRLRAVTKAACPLVDATVWNDPLKRAYRECDAWRERALELVDEEQPALVLIASADMYEIVDAGGDRLDAGEEEAWDAALTGYLARLAARAPTVVVLADTPRVGYLAADCLAKGRRHRSLRRYSRAHGRRGLSDARSGGSRGGWRGHRLRDRLALHGRGLPARPWHEPRVPRRSPPHGHLRSQAGRDARGGHRCRARSRRWRLRQPSR